MSSLSFASFRLPKFFFYKQGFSMLFPSLGTVCGFILVQGTSHIPGKRAAPGMVWTVIWCVRFLLSWLCNWQWHFACLGLFFVKPQQERNWLLCLHACWAFLLSAPFCLLRPWEPRFTLLDLGTPDCGPKEVAWQLIPLLYKSSAGGWDIPQGWILLVSYFGFLLLEENHSSKNLSWFTVQTNKSIGFEFHVWLWVTLLRKVIWVGFSFPESWLSSS